MSRSRSPLQIAVLCIAYCTAFSAPSRTSSAAPAAPREFVALEREAAGPDFIIQGEYVGEAITPTGTRKMAAQVVAIGAHAFRAYLLQGGLPGAGWDGAAKITVQGRTENDATVLQGPRGYSVTVDGQTLTGQTDSGDRFELKKTVRQSPTLGAPAPAHATVLFDGTDTKAWVRARVDSRKLLAAMYNASVFRVGEGPTTRQKYQDFTVHVEFRIPFKPFGRGQGRGNSGIILQNRYEVQILDTFGTGLGNTTAEGDVCGDVFGKSPASINMCLPPLSWQTYDIEFRAARYNTAGKKVRNAVVTIQLNGVTIQHHREINGATYLQQPEAPQPGPVVLQDHGNAIFFRNIWIVPR